MMNIVLVTFLAVVVSVTADPLLYSTPYVSSPYAPLTSAAYVGSPYYAGPSAALLAAPSAAVVAQQQWPATVPAAVPAALPAAIPATVPYSSVSAYTYGSSYSVQDYLPTLVNTAAQLTAAPLAAAPLAYSLPYAYAADYFYRR